MESLLNFYSNAYVVAAVVDACRRADLFATISRQPGISLKELTDLHAANAGYLAVALHLLESTGWLARGEDGGYQLTPHADLDAVPQGILALYQLPVDTLLDDPAQRKLISQYVEQWCAPKMSCGANGCGKICSSDCVRHGPVLLPLLIALGKLHSESYLSRREFILEKIDAPLGAGLRSFFCAQGWASMTSEDTPRCCLTERGSALIEAADDADIAVSYRPMLANIDILLFGNAKTAFEPRQDGFEPHVDHRLNVRASDLQHERYFADVEWQILALFNHRDFAAQPRYIADIGCGDGSYLRQLYEAISTRTLRGRVLGEFPLTLVGVDNRQGALEETRDSLARLPHVLIRADINQPLQLKEQMQEQGIAPEQVLHIRSFLNHNVSLTLDQRKTDRGDAFALTPGCVYVDADGHALAPQVLVHHWRAHLRDWASMISAHGLIVAESHCMDAQFTRSYPDSENLYFDHLHAFSGQYLIEAEIFLILAANVGLFAARQPLRYPRELPINRVTVSHFHKRPYQIRHARAADLPELLALEACAAPQERQACGAILQQCVELYPQGQFVLEVDGCVVGAIYSKRVAAVTAAPDAGALLENHQADGAIVELLAMHIRPDWRASLGEALAEFMQQRCSIMNGVESVCGDRVGHSPAAPAVRQKSLPNRGNGALAKGWPHQAAPACASHPTANVACNSDGRSCPLTFFIFPPEQPHQKMEVTASFDKQRFSEESIRKVLHDITPLATSLLDRKSDNS